MRTSRCELQKMAFTLSLNKWTRRHARFTWGLQTMLTRMGLLTNLIIPRLSSRPFWRTTACEMRLSARLWARNLSRRSIMCHWNVAKRCLTMTSTLGRLTMSGTCPSSTGASPTCSTTRRGTTQTSCSRCPASAESKQVRLRRRGHASLFTTKIRS